MPTLDLETLKAAVSGSSPGIRSVSRLQPAGGVGDKVFPPTYTKEGKVETKYAFERRRIDERDVDVVLLDSVASQANRMEEALLESWREGKFPLPVVLVDFSKVEGLEDLDQITALQAPHRLADALLRDSLYGGKLFRYSEIGREFGEARPDNATAIYKYCPTALVFGMWDSTGPKGGLGAKFQRALVSEIVGIGAVPGKKTASRLDPAQIQRRAEVFQHPDPEEDWTDVEQDAVRDKSGPRKYPSKKKKADAGRPSAVNHGNHPPSIDVEAGGVTMDYGLHTAVLSLVALRRLRFRTTIDREPIAGAKRPTVETAARVALATLSLAAMVGARTRGYDLRSRSLLVPTAPFGLDILDANGGEARRYELDHEGACALVRAAESEARALGMGWNNQPIELQPAEKLCRLILRSRMDPGAGEDADEAEGK